MRGFLLEAQGIAQTAAVFAGGGCARLEPLRPISQVDYRSRMSSNIPACSENRYPSLMARSVHPPRRPRHPFSPRIRLPFAETDSRRFSCFASRQTRYILSDIETRQRAGTSCVNPFLFSAFCPQRHWLVVCPPMANARLPVPPQARLSRMQPTITRSRAQPSARSRAPIATTRAYAANPSRLIGALPRTRHCNQLSWPCRQGGFFVTETITPAFGSRRGAADRADMI